MNIFKRQNIPTAAAEANPGYDVINGEPTYTRDVATLIENPPSILLNPVTGVVPVTQLGRPGLGPDNVQLFQSGPTSYVPDNPADEQGVGRAPGWTWAHYPHVQQFNDTLLSETYMQDGGGFHAFSERVQRQPIWPEGYLHYTQLPGPMHGDWPEVATVNQPEIPSFTEWVPSVGGY